MKHSGGSSTMVATPAELHPVRLKNLSRSSERVSLSGHSLRSMSRTDDEDRSETLPSPITASAEAAERWNSSSRNIWKVSTAFWSFGIMGLNDATYGAIIPYLQPFYGLTYAVVSLVFLSPFVGYTLSAVLNNTIHLKLGQRGVAFIGPLCHLLAYIIIAVHPPFPVLVISFVLAGFGNGILDGGWNAWIGAMANANELLGFLHACYGLGATIAPLIATTMITKAGLPWYYWYYCMVGFAAAELIVSVQAFWKNTGAKFREQHCRTSDEKGSSLREATMKKPAAKITWLCSLFLLGYMGVEVALGGWIVEFMIKVRDAEEFAAGMSATGFWLGMTVGRVALGFITPRIGEKLSIMIYLPIAIGLQLLLWLVPQYYVSTVAVAFQGFFLGPCFPAAVAACTNLLPKHLHVSSIGFAAAFGGSGGAIFPYAVGAIAQAKGVQVLQPIILALMAVIWLLWVMLPRMNRKRD